MKLEQNILKLLPQNHFDLIITHNPSGEYTRHLRHEETGKAVINLWHTGNISTDELWTFAYKDGIKNIIKAFRNRINLPRTDQTNMA